MKKYELLLILPGTFDEQEAKNKVEEIVNMLKEYAQDVEINSLGKNRLAYPIRQIRYGYFYTAIFNAEIDKLSVIYEKLNLMRELLRAMVTHFNTKAVGNQKITYFMEEGGITRRDDEERKPRVIMDRAVALEQVEEQVVVPTKEENTAQEVVVEEVKFPKVAANEKQVDLKEIDKKLDEILSDSSSLDI
ncbi:MAG: 30S ribosomal protein S6 [Candidatus Magasanikbacteria bacterium CG10_big_fil_rev_8_21_14_0_10_36_32]|uniref:Small ribosomal subunit protein bS6 n=1 Tax=Candidatus Magasanikbacteria bacterium CG10_big_fil_rev_8_21_14_0_10_36_32 TaxID=1974646 RepID=A0A2M6W731_9BACT|nr:MAG: 30S ribosomal protein S6 [Candidatus Magasanikbacteria bacterium CG10_big_fil_rev_8_21_14_0_10_36_32]